VCSQHYCLKHLLQTCQDCCLKKKEASKEAAASVVVAAQAEGEGSNPLASPTKQALEEEFPEAQLKEGQPTKDLLLQPHFLEPLLL
jgi:hypothetical protein